MKSMKYHYWVSQCNKGYQLSEDEETYEDIAEQIIYQEADLWVYRVQDVIYAQLFPLTYIIN